MRLNQLRAIEANRNDRCLCLRECQDLVANPQAFSKQLTIRQDDVVAIAVGGLDELGTDRSPARRDHGLV